MLALAIVLVSGAFFQNPVPGDLNAYVHKADSSYAWHNSPRFQGRRTLSLVSQTWKGVVWKHSIVISSPARPVARDTAVIYITGDNPDTTDEKDADTMSRESGLPVATLYNIPVQPIRGLQEDELIASTFEDFLKSGSPSDLLLWPMAKSVIRTMDALKSWSHGRLKRFVLWGESKRAWTAWLAAGTGDKRIIGIAPCSFDNLNMSAQLKLQKEEWGHLSPAINAYTKRGLQETLSTPEGWRLAELVDPYTYLGIVDGDEVHHPGIIKTKILTIRGTNDPYWALDAYNKYRLAMPEDATLLVLPNEGHDFKDKRLYLRTVGAFAACCTTGTRWPKFRMKIFRDLYLAALSDHRADSLRLWITDAKSPEPQNAHWYVLRHTTKQSYDRDYESPYEYRFKEEFGTGTLAEADFTLSIRGRKHHIALSSIPIFAGPVR